MPDKPSYLGLLNAIAVAESAAGEAFTEWAELTKDKRLAKTLRLVAMRESEHGLAFAKRIMELGYDVREPGGDAVRTLDGVKCLGGCEPATPAHCERVVVE